MTRKLKLSLQEARWFAEVDDYVRHYNVRGRSLVQAFSDVHDSNLFPSEVARLVKRRLLRTIRLPAKDGPGNGLMGDCVTYDLTQRAMAILWPSRIVLAQK